MTPPTSARRGLGRSNVGHMTTSLASPDAPPGCQMFITNLPCPGNHPLMLTQRRLRIVVLMDGEALLTVAEYSRDVAVLQWPAQESERQTLARLGLPRLLVLDASSTPPPLSPSCLEDWTRVPVESRDLRARLATLAARGNVHCATPRLDPLGQLWHRGACIRLSPTEERLATVLAGRFGEIVPDEELLEAGWTGWEQGETTPGRAENPPDPTAAPDPAARPRDQVTARVGHVLRDTSVDTLDRVSDRVGDRVSERVGRPCAD